MPIMNMVRVAVEIAALALFAVLSREVTRLQARGRRLDRDVVALSRTVATVQAWAAQELRALRSEFTVARVNDSAAEVMARRAEARAEADAAARAPELEDDLDEQRDTVAMPAPGASAEAPGDDDATSVFDRDPPLYAARFATMRPPAPLADPDLIGCEDVADEVARAPLGADEATPPRRGRAAVLVPAFRGPEPDSAA